MPFVISAGTFITGFGIGFQSVSVNQQPNIQRLYQLGNFLPYDKNITYQTTLNISKYGGQADVYDVTASNSCIEPAPITITVLTSSCTGQEFIVTDDFFINSYSYSKDVQGWGVESYSLTTRPQTLDANGDPVTGVTTRLIRGTAEGQSEINAGADTGIVFAASPTVDGIQMQVSAGNPGIGTADDTRFGEVIQVGAGTGKKDGTKATGNVTVPYTPIYIAS